MTEQAFALYLAGIGAIAAVVVALWLIYWVYKAKLLEREERRLMIEKGIAPPPPQPTGWPAVRAREQELCFEERRLRLERGLDPEPKKAPATREDHLRRGIVALFLGIGVGVAYLVVRVNLDLAIPETRDWLLGLSIVGPILTLYGLAHLLYSRTIKDRPPHAAA